MNLIWTFEVAMFHEIPSRTGCPTWIQYHVEVHRCERHRDAGHQSQQEVAVQDVVSVPGHGVDREVATVDELRAPGYSNLSIGALIQKFHKKKASTARTDASNLINDIISNFGTSLHREVALKVTALTKHLFAHQYLLYSDLNCYLVSSGVLGVLISSLERSQEQTKRDILRLIYLFLQVNKNLRCEARQSSEFQSFLFKCLVKVECWQNFIKYKHHINIASQLLADRAASDCAFNAISIRKLVLSAISDAVVENLQEKDEFFPCIIFYASLMVPETCNDLSKNCEEEPDADKILNKEVTGKCMDIMRDYIQDFKTFYMEDLERSHFILYKPKWEYSFQQISNTVIYYSLRSNILRMNIFQGGVYGMINNLLSIKHIPEDLIFYGQEILRLTSLDDTVFKGVKNDYMSAINDKISVLLKREPMSDKTKMLLRELQTMYETCETDSFPRPSGDLIRPSPRENSPVFVSHVEDWDREEVKHWLQDNHLEDLREVFSYLTGRGLRQLQSLVKETEKMTILMFFVEKMRIRFDLSLELISALEKL